MCNNCGDCIRTCPVNALSLKEGKVVWDKDVCVGCDTCIKTCTHNASPKITMMSVDEVLEQVLASSSSCMTVSSTLLLPEKGT